jgi:hypothetical protein
MCAHAHSVPNKEAVAAVFLSVEKTLLLLYPPVDTCTYGGQCRCLVAMCCCCIVIGCGTLHGCCAIVFRVYARTYPLVSRLFARQFLYITGSVTEAMRQWSFKRRMHVHQKCLHDKWDEHTQVHQRTLEPGKGCWCC